MIQAGDVFERLTVLDASVVVNRRRKALVICECGTEKVVDASNLKTGNTRSCGCLHREQLAQRNYRHGLDVTDYPYNLWSSIKARCHRPSYAGYLWYGARGITMWEPWRLDPGAFVWWLSENLGPRPEGYSLDRIDNDGNYEPGNLRWASAAQQAANRRPKDQWPSQTKGVR